MGGSGRALPPSSTFAGDDGSADPGLAAALAAYGHDGSGPTTQPPAAGLPRVVEALATARVLVPVVAGLETSEVTEAGLEMDKEASAAVVALRAPDGRTALPVFTSVDAMTRWRRDARPVAAEAARAATSAIQEGWEVLVVDPAGPVTVVVPRPAVRALASGTRWEPAVRSGAVAGEVRDAVARLAEVEHVVAALAEPGRSAEVAVVLAVRPGLGRDRLDRVLGQVNGRLAADPTVVERVDSIELRVTSAEG